MTGFVQMGHIYYQMTPCHQLSRIRFLLNTPAFTSTINCCDDKFYLIVHVGYVDAIQFPVTKRLPKWPYSRTKSGKYVS